MPVPTDITAGTLTITNGSTAVTGVGTSWLASDLRQGDVILWIEGGDGFQTPILADVPASNTALVLAEPWQGPTLTGVRYRIRYQWDSSRVSAQSRQLIELLDNGNILALASLTGPGVPVFDGPHSMEIRTVESFINGVAYDVQVDTLADRAAYDGQAAGFSVLVSDVGDGRSAVYSKASNTSGDWTDPAYVTGPVGPLPGIEATVATGAPGSTATVDEVPITGGVRLEFTLPAAEGFYNAGVYDSGAAYTKDQVVRHNGSSFIALQAVPAGTSPSSAFPPVDTAFWQVLAAKGSDGTGTGDVAGPSGAVAGNIVVFDGTTGKLIADGGPLVAPLFAPQGRLSLVSGVPVPSNDIAGATTIYYVPTVGNKVPVYDGSAFTQKTISGQLVHALSATYHPNAAAYDEWVFMDGATLRMGTGPAWSAGAVAGSFTARGSGAGSTEIELFNGIYVNKNSIVIRWGTAVGNTVTVPARGATLVGSFITSAAGQASDTLYRRLLSNSYNQTERLISEFPDTTPNWTYSTAVFRASNNNGNTVADYFQSLSGTIVKAVTKTKVTSSGGVVVVGMGIRFDGVVAVTEFVSVSNARIELIYLFLNGQAGMGYHALGLSEYGAGSDTQTWYGGAGRLTGTVLN